MSEVKILIVEDESIVAMELDRYLSDLGFKVIGTAESGNQAIEKAQHQCPDLILMDIHIKGGLNGIETAVVLRERFGRPVIFLTALMDDVKIEQAKVAVPYGYLLKPVQKRELKAAIEIALHRAELDRQVKEQMQFLNHRVERLSSTLNSIGDAIISTDIYGNIVNMNQVAQALTGWSLDESLGKPTSDVFKPIDAATREELDCNLSKEGALKESILPEQQMLLISRTGQEIPISIRIAALKSSTGVASGVVIVFRDQTRENELQRQLEESEVKYKTAFQISPDAVNINRMDGQYIDINEGFTNLTGFTREDCIGNKSVDMDIWAIPKDREILIEGLKINGYVQNLESKFRCKDGSLKMGLMSARLIELNGEPHILSVTKDISARYSAEKELMRQKELIELITETSPVGITVISREGRFLYANRAAEELMGISLQEIKNRTYKDPQWKLVDYDGKTFLEKDHPFDQVMETKKPVVEVIQGIEWPNGKRVMLSVNAAPLLDDEGNVTGIVNTLVNITRRLEAEQQVHSLLLEKETLLKEVHHRIKNNIMAVQSLLSLQAFGINNDECVSALENAKDRLQSIMVLYDKLYRSQDYTKMSLMDYLPDLVDEIVVNYPRQIPLTIKKECVDIILDANSLSSLGIIINELLTNTFKHAFSPVSAGEVKVSAYEEGDQLMVEISDNGKGMPADFDLESSDGFGLKLVKLMTAQLQGVLKIISDNGTTFLISISPKLL